MRTLIKDTPHSIGKKITLFGWVHVRRDHGKLIFIDLRDASGIVQIVCNPKNEALLKKADALRSEWVIRLEGEVKARPEKMINKEIPTGTVEIEALDLEVLAEADTPPFALDTDGYELNEENRLEYRYLDLRRPRLQKNFRYRSEFVQHIRNFLHKEYFIEIETPLLTKSTPEGSRDFVVPSRIQPGHFYALPQSPQQYKQLLMVAGFEKYFQIARALRDEDLRADRGFEHSQVDLEMSFVSRDDVMNLVERLVIYAAENMKGIFKQKPFPVFSYHDAVKKFGADKFDLRSDDEKKKNILACAWVIDFPVFEKDADGKWTYSHNPFTASRSEDETDLLQKKNIDKLISLQYDLVCNGHEVGGGGIRIHKPDVLHAVFEIIGHSPKMIESQFGHMLRAFRYGAPPHGGIALGIERLLMTLLGEDYIREVQAFPMTSGGRTAVMDAPSPLSDKQLKELGISVEKKKD